MTQRIESLTPEQEALLPVWAEKWKKIGLSTEPLDVEAAKEAICRAYAAAELPPPKRFVVCDSPLSGAITAALLKLGPKVWESVWRKANLDAYKALRDSVTYAAWSEVLTRMENDALLTLQTTVGNAAADDILHGDAGSDAWRAIWGATSDPALQGIRHGVANEAWRAAQLPLVGDMRNLMSVLRAVEIAVHQDAGRQVWDKVWSGAEVGRTVDNSLADSVQAAVSRGVWFPLEDSVWNSVQGSVLRGVEDSAEGDIGDAVHRILSLWGKAGDDVDEGIWKVLDPDTRYKVIADMPKAVESIVWHGVRRAVRISATEDAMGSTPDTPLRYDIQDAVRASVYGAHDAHWLAFYDYFLEVCGLECVEPLRPLIDLAHHCGWWIPYENLCIIQHRPRELHLDSEGRLHNPNDMAVKYPDGWGVYAIHGVRVPLEKAFIITDPNRITLADIESESNVELRRVMLDLFGPDRYIAESGMRPFQKDRFGELYARTVPNDETIVMVRVTNATAEPDGTFKKYWLRVPPTMQTAHEAVAWTFGMTPEEYNPIQES